MPTVIRAVAFANGAPCPFAGMFLCEFDADAYDGIGWADYTPEPARALHFEDQRAAFEFWQTQSKVKPLRPDGKPNRPLTATTILIEPAPDA